METVNIDLDVHAHLIPLDLGRLKAIDGVLWDSEAERLIVDGHPVGVKSLFRPEELLAWMKSNNVAHSWISIPPPLYRQELVEKDARVWVDYINSGLNSLVENSSGAFSALVHLPIEHPSLAAEVARDWIAQGHRLFSMPAGTGDHRTLDEPEFEQLWLALDEAKSFLFLHPGECSDGRLQAHYLTNLIGNPYESAVALSRMVMGGVLDRFRQFTPCVAHGGGLLPMVVGRLDRGFETSRPGVRRDIGKPSAYLHRVFCDCICHDENALELSEQVFGRDNVVFGSDWPFPMGLIEPATQLSSFEKTRISRIQKINSKRLRSRFSCEQGEQS